MSHADLVSPCSREYATRNSKTWSGCVTSSEKKKDVIPLYRTHIFVA